MTQPEPEIPIKKTPIKQSEIPGPEEIVRHESGVTHIYSPSDCDDCMHITDVVLEGQ